MPTEANGFEYPENVRFQCTRCTKCCGDTLAKTRHIIMVEVEARRICEATLQPIVAFAHRIEGRAPYVYEMRKNQTGKCVFLKEDSCSVYAFRPLVCRFYPFELKPEERGGHLFSFTNECSGIGEGKRLRLEEFRKLMREAKDRLG
ncbi:MAG TPA: YkgJ family cysteine cluster protein [Patescibacteria group bacterium]|nr:YkgJ family cysteine cluster protein [Patescibacteria group bacterium]